MNKGKQVRYVDKNKESILRQIFIQYLGYVLPVYYQEFFPKCPTLSIRLHSLQIHELYLPSTNTNLKFRKYNHLTDLWINKLQVSMSAQLVRLHQCSHASFQLPGPISSLPLLLPSSGVVQARVLLNSAEDQFRSRTEFSQK